MLTKREKQLVTERARVSRSWARLRDLRPAIERLASLDVDGADLCAAITGLDAMAARVACMTCVLQFKMADFEALVGVDGR